MSAYKRWQSCRGLGTRSFGERVLFIQGKPGYGKTTLCSLIISNLSRKDIVIDYNSDAWHDTQDVVFYFFEKQRRQSNRVGDAFRAILAQLLHLHRKDKLLIDILSVLWVKEEATGQFTATDNQVFSLLHLILHRIGQIILVFDGIDECADKDLFFFGELHGLTEGAHNCSILLSGRPTTTLPKFFGKDYSPINLSESQNLLDIERYLRPKIGELLDSGALVVVAHDNNKNDLENIVGTIAARANGMFLWAILLVEYLQSPGLTIRQRWEAIENINLLEGLDALYEAILHTIRLRFPSTARRNIRRIFQWVARAHRPLHINELQNVIAIPLNGPVEEGFMIPNFEKSVGPMSGALLEVAEDRTVRFIHLSVVEYLLKESAETRDGPSNGRQDLEVDQASTDQYLATCCLSYFCHTIPSEPLSGSPQETPGAGYQMRRFPALEYVAQYWSHHLFTCLGRLPNSSDASRRENDGSLQQLTNLATSFLFDRRKVTVWIEASWLFKNPPSIILPLEELRTLSGLGILSPSEGKLLFQAFSHLKRWSADLETLNNFWGHVLRDSPNEIWEPSISAFTRSDFWFSVPGARLTHIAVPSKSERKSILIRSQVSANGLELGLIRLAPPDSAFLCDSEASLPSQGWVASYEIWSLQTYNIICRFDLDLPQCELRHFLFHENVRRESENRDRIELPTAICSDLRRVVILSCVIELNLTAISPLPTTLHYWLNLELFVSKSQSIHNCLFSPNYELRLDPSEKYLLVARMSDELKEVTSSVNRRAWLLDIYCFATLFTNDKTKVNQLASHVLFSPSGVKLNALSRNIVFHPFLPQLAFTRWNDTVLWNFLDKARPPMWVYKAPLGEMSFSLDGHYLFGTDGRRRVTVNLEKKTPTLSAVRRQPRWFQHRNLLRSGEDQNIVQHHQSQAVQTTNNPVVLRNANGMDTISVLRQMEAEGAVVLRSLCEDGTMKTETLTRLPESIKSISSATLLDLASGEGTKAVRLMLNKAPQNFYQLTDTGGNGLPAILERLRTTIPTVIGKRGMALRKGEDEWEEHYGLYRKRLKWEQDGKNRPRSRD